MQEYKKESASRHDVLEWIRNVMDARIKEEEIMVRQYRSMDDEAQAVYFENRLKWDYVGRVLIMKDLEKCGDDEEDPGFVFESSPLEK